MPRTSIVITTRDKTDSLSRVLHSLTQQTDQDFDLFVCNDAGSRATEALCHDYERLLPVTHVWSTPPGCKSRGAGCSRNVGIKLATAGRILIIDDDSCCPPDLVASHSIYGDQDLAIVGFRSHIAQNTWRSELPQRYHELPALTHKRDIRQTPPKPGGRTQEDDAKDHVRSGSDKISQSWWTCHVSAPTASLRAVGGFWEKFIGSGCEDSELALRLWRNGTRFIVLSEPVVYHLDHPICELQSNNWGHNRKYYMMTVGDKKAIVRNTPKDPS